MFEANTKNVKPKKKCNLNLVHDAAQVQRSMQPRTQPGMQSRLQPKMQRKMHPDYTLDYIMG